MQSVKRSPDFQFQRLVTTADVAPFTEKHGINLRGYKKALIQVIPVTEDALSGDFDSAELTPGTSDPEIAVYSWSAQLGRFIAHNPESVLPGLGAGVPYEFTVDTDGQILFVAVTAGIVGGEGVVILASGFEAIEASC